MLGPINGTSNKGAVATMSLPVGSAKAQVIPLEFVSTQGEAQCLLTG